MTIYVACVCDDLKRDAELYAEAFRYTYAADFGKVGKGDTAILYAHGQYYLCKHHSAPKANNKIVWGGTALTAEKTASALQKDLALAPAQGITIIVHACFTAGTVEKAPREREQMNTFAGQLCRAMAGTFPGLVVFGYQGQTKVGTAGYPLKVDPKQRRRSRSMGADPNEGHNFAVGYGFSGSSGLVVIKNQGESVVWR
jgi:hypothetical protein